MALRIRRALANGVPRTFRRNGWILAGAYLVVTLVQTGFVLMVATTALPLGAGAGPGAGSGMPSPGTRLPPLVSFLAVALASLTGGVLTVPVTVVGTRTLVSEYTDRVPEEFVFHRLGWATLNCLAGSWLVAAATGLLAVALLGVASWGVTSLAGEGALFALFETWPGRAVLVAGALVLLLPSAFLSVALVFVGQEVAVKDKNVLGAAVGSWRLARHNWLRLFALLLVAFVPQLLFSVVATRLLSPTPAQLLIAVESSVFQIAVLAVLARAYVYCHDGDELGRVALFAKVE